MDEGMDKYHKYLTSNYERGVDRFFAPTGALASFERKMKLSAAARQEAVYARSVDDAVEKLEPVVTGGEGVFDLVAEPGTGKTTVLPFRFPSKRVVVALPSPFDAWSAYCTASGPAKLHLKGLHMGKGDNVCYMDSYLAANMVMSGFMDYDVLIVDECDSGKGVTAFLAGVKAPGKVLIRMSASHGRSGGGPSHSFAVVEDNSMPDVREGCAAVASFVNVKSRGRCLVMAPDFGNAAVISELIPGSVLLCIGTSLGTLSKSLKNMADDVVYVTDDVCGRGVNLNLDMVFDCQTVVECGVQRNLTAKEIYQRKYRIGRNRPGFYFSPGLSSIEHRVNDADIMRSNVMRVYAELPQEGGTTAHINEAEVTSLLVSSVEPYLVVSAPKTSLSITPKSSRSNSNSSAGSFISVKSGSSESSRKSRKVATLPSWLAWAATAVGDSTDGKTYYVSSEGYSRSKSGGTRLASSGGSDMVRSAGANVSSLGPVAHSDIAEGAPFARRGVAVTPRGRAAVVAPRAPPVMDLTQSTYDMDWPALLGSLMEKRVDLPTMVPPHGWLYTSATGLGSDWARRLDNMAASDHYRFDNPELETVVRAWNSLVAASWVKGAPGLSNAGFRDSLEFCLRYFQAFSNCNAVG